MWLLLLLLGSKGKPFLPSVNVLIIYKFLKPIFSTLIQPVLHWFGLAAQLTLKPIVIAQLRRESLFFYHWFSLHMYRRKSIMVQMSAMKKRKSSLLWCSRIINSLNVEGSNDKGWNTPFAVRVLLIFYWWIWIGWTMKPSNVLIVIIWAISKSYSFLKGKGSFLEIPNLVLTSRSLALY